MIAPDIAERVRDILAVNRPQEIWSQRRPEIEREILDAVRYNLHTNLNPVGMPDVDFVHVEDVLMTGVTLPAGVQDAIIAKQTADQDQQKWDYVLMKEKKEAERKRIEASGIRAFQDVISYGLTDSYLRWRGIEATLELAKSNNAKVVVIGNPANGLPLILGNLDDKAGAAATVPPAPAGTPTGQPPAPEPSPTGRGDLGAAVPGLSGPRATALGDSNAAAPPAAQRDIAPAMRRAGPLPPGNSTHAGPAHPGSSVDAGPPQPGSVMPGVAPAARPSVNAAAPATASPGNGTARPSQAAPAAP
jgi:hypothetical protein